VSTKKKRKKYKRLTLEQASALWKLGIDCERRWDDERFYVSVTRIWGPYREGSSNEVDFYVTQDGLFFRVGVE